MIMVLIAGFGLGIGFSNLTNESERQLQECLTASDGLLEAEKKLKKAENDLRVQCEGLKNDVDNYLKTTR